MKITQKRSCFSWAIVFLILVIATTSYAQVTLTPSIHRAPYNISCFGGSDGSISLVVSGGVAPYKYTWSNGATTQNIGNLPAGYYSVVVHDGGTLSWNAEVTLLEPRDLEVVPLAYKYPNEYNISLNGACNGMISVTVNNGIPPYSYLWRDGNTSQSRTSLCRGSYGLILTDANGCSVSTETIDLLEPERSDWTMTGNSNTNPTVQYIGTTDSTDLIFKTNNLERLRLSKSGTLNFKSLSGGNGDFLVVDSLGNILKAGNPNTGIPCNYWSNCGNSILFNSQTNTTPHFVGTTNTAPLVFKTSNVERLRLTQTGNLGLGVSNPTDKLEVDGTLRITHLGYASNSYAVITNVDNDNNKAIAVIKNNTDENFVVFGNGNVWAREIHVRAPGIPFPDYVFHPDYKLKSIPDLKLYIEENQHLPEVVSADEVKNSGINLAEMQAILLKKIEELTLYVILQQEQIDNLKCQIEK